MLSTQTQNCAKSDPSKPLHTFDAKKVQLLEKVIKFSTSAVNFFQCLPQSTKSGSIDFKLTKKLKKPMNLTTQIQYSENENYKRNPVFGLESQNKMTQKRQITLGVNLSRSETLRLKVFTKPTSSEEGPISALVKIYRTQFPNDYVLIPLSVECVIPQIYCSKELHFGDHRVIKCGVIEGKTEKTVKIPFVLKNDTPLTLQACLAGPQNQKIAPVSIKKNKIDLKGNSQFYLELTTNYTGQISQKVIQLEETKTGSNYEVRKIIIFKIIGTNFHYHYPLVINYFSGNQTEEEQ